MCCATIWEGADDADNAGDDAPDSERIREAAWKAVSPATSGSIWPIG